MHLMGVSIRDSIWDLIRDFMAGTVDVGDIVDAEEGEEDMKLDSFMHRVRSRKVL